MMTRSIVGVLVAIVSGLCWAQDPGPEAVPEDPWQEATLYRDEWGVPHIYAQNAFALGYAFGYAQAEDHLEAMLMAYRMANGRMAEVLGTSYADSDAFSLKVGHGQLARAAFDALDPLMGELCTGFSQGVNAWLSEHPGGAPEWAEGVQPPDILALWHAFLMSMAPMDLPEVYRPPRAFDTGNAWALAPPRTEEGKTILVINPHQYYDGPFQWYEAHLVMGDLNVAGATLFGLPVILQGYNASLGWALTPNEADTADVFEESVAQEKNGKRKMPIPGVALDAGQLYMMKYMSASQSYRVRSETGLEERFVPVVLGDRGPMFDLHANALFSWRIGGYRDFGGLQQLFEMGRAQTLEAFQQALLAHQLPCFHILYADREGNLFYTYYAKTGVRAMPESALQERMDKGADYLDWKKPVPADVDAMTWANLIPPTALPHIVNPPSGFLQACGNPPWTVTDNPPFAAEDVAPWLVGDPDSFRAKRVRQLLRSGKRSFRDNQIMLYDVVAPAAVEITPLLLRMAEQRPELISASHPDLNTGLTLLREWNYVAETASVGMTFYHVWWAALRAQSGFVDPGDDQLYRLLQSNTPMAQEIALNAAGEAARMMRNNYPGLSIPWGEAHRIQRGPRNEAMPGAVTGEPILVSGDCNYVDGRWQADYGYGYALAVQFGNVPEAFSIVPFGVSERPDSPHYSDQMDLFLQKRLKRTRFLQDAVWRYAQAAHGRHVVLYPLGVEGAFTFSASAPITARLSTSAQAPSPLPEKMSPFTLYVVPEHVPEAVPVELLMEFHVPEAVCKPEHLGDLALFVFEKDLGWYIMPGERIDKEKAVFTGKHAGGAVYAVLGPDEVLEQPEEERSAPSSGSAHVPKPKGK
ncbi:MAG TPA: penicillin acylase family protein [Candidatus Hydrogenedentes bacterium]|nr:penicillin acylase family protein [Candidatus Hydrogenedentota bacterium]